MDARYFQFVEKVVSLLTTCEARYAIGGSFASSLYGEARMTYDVDINVQLALENVGRFVELCQPFDFLVTLERVQEAVKTGTDFQIIDMNNALKADFYAVGLPLSLRQQRTLDRARSLTYGDGTKTAYFMSPEDVILYKLDWFMMGKSQKHLRDVGAMITVQGDALDYAYLEEWVGESREVWVKLIAEHRRRNGE